ncbi:MAG: nascent polypeptide-associated complex protein [Thermoplasmata archaeon]|nr:MAG: nascent polypeptide-associated complex protein [Thermoplasmata archaeon]
MFPGMGGRGMNPRQMKQMMRKMGMTIDEVSDVEEILIKTATQDYVFKDAEVTIIDIQGQQTFQIVGTPEIVAKESEEGGSVVPQEDVELVAAQANVSLEDARQALEECGGNPAEAIVKLMETQE